MSSLGEFLAELTEFAVELSEFPLPKQYSRNSIRPFPSVRPRVERLRLGTFRFTFRFGIKNLSGQFRSAQVPP